VALSGFHDPRGSQAKNEQLALERAGAVRKALVAAGIAADRIDLRKPDVMVGSGSKEEARRVEVGVER
jgi:outer membrane protein OmpA-like peptidoglycan-associated protein